MNYCVYRDWGAGILNVGQMICTNCIFTGNYAKNGGAIFNQGLLILANCSFADNIGYDTGDDICVGEGGKVIVDGELIESSNGLVTFAERISLTEKTVISVLCLAGSFVIGGIAGFLTANPFIGDAIGTAVGAAIGTAGASYIISKSYDANFNRMLIACLLIGGSALSGALGGLVGGWIGAAKAAVAEDLAAEKAAEALHYAQNDLGYGFEVLKWLTKLYKILTKNNHDSSPNFLFLF